MLFQPTNIFPSLTGGLGNGVADVNSDLTVSWQVNGNTPMTSFQIVIYKNDATSTKLYDTGTLTDGCPFHGISYTGEIQFFSYTISHDALHQAGVRNGGEYKLIITQSWDGGSVTQSAASAFHAKETPVIKIAKFPQQMPFSKYTFELEYPDNSDPLNWMRWRVATWDNTSNEPSEILYDTGDIFGASDLRCFYDGFLAGITYAIVCDVETVYGVQTTTGWNTFIASYTLLDYPGIVTAKRICGHTGVLLSWDKLIYIPGNISGDYILKDGTLELSEGAKIYWDHVNGSQMNLQTPWTFLFRGKLSEIPGEISLTTRNCDISLSLANADGFTYIQDSSGNDILDSSGNKIEANAAGYTLFVAKTNGEIVSSTPIAQSGYVDQIAVTPTKLIYTTVEFSGGLFPTSTLHPSNELYPKPTSEIITSTYTIDLSYTQTELTKISVTGPILCDYLWVVGINADGSYISNIFSNASFEPSFDNKDTLFAAKFENELGAGNVPGLSADLTGIAVYRRTGASGTLKRIADMPLSQSSVADFSVSSQMDYTYYLYPYGAMRIETTPLTSKTINICFWDWAILECAEDSSGVFHVVSEYLFGKNLSSGSISNNNSPNILENFTQYPLVQLRNANYMSGTLSSLIGIIRDCEYSDTIAQKNAIYALSTSQNALFLKSRKGDIWRIRIAGNIQMDTMDDTKQQAQTASIPWVQTASAENSAIISTPNENFFINAL